MTGKSEYKNKWVADNFDRITLVIPKGYKSIVKSYAASKGISMNAYINNLIKRDLAIDKSAESYNAGKL